MAMKISQISIFPKPPSKLWMSCTKIKDPTSNISKWMSEPWSSPKTPLTPSLTRAPSILLSYLFGYAVRVGIQYQCQQDVDGSLQGTRQQRSLHDDIFRTSWKQTRPSQEEGVLMGHLGAQNNQTYHHSPNQPAFPWQFRQKFPLYLYLHQRQTKLKRSSDSIRQEGRSSSSSQKMNANFYNLSLLCFWW